MKRLLLAILIILAIQVVNAQKIYTESYKTSVGKNVTVEVFAENFTSVAGIDVKITFNPEVVEVTSVSIKKFKCMKFDNLDNSEGFYRFLVICTNPITFEKEKLVTLQFKALKAGTSELKISAMLSVDINGTLKLVIPKTADGCIEVSKVRSSGTFIGTSGGRSSGQVVEPQVVEQVVEQPTQQATPEQTTPEEQITEQTTPKHAKQNQTQKAESITPTTTLPETPKTGRKMEEKITEKPSFEHIKIPGFEIVAAVTSIVLVTSRKL